MISIINNASQPQMELSLSPVRSLRVEIGWEKNFVMYFKANIGHYSQLWLKIEDLKYGFVAIVTSFLKKLTFVFFVSYIGGFLYRF